ncbi:hypothetical protein CYLTODRAFT_419697 [Cylindrobasidium torrendii FP15055 ss-10]|uniref:Uncharacterized protein n=1 Tax=Cylindrobasidium torrendii FP15055 ss-10 TaxID=1314674 RepID=A0A0D7BLI4_9AGAR|nr:hypothetical protein CYLTODRAFT_419697 [Cylindrobasidium torrendii FP15055 ss-10]
MQLPIIFLPVLFVLAAAQDTAQTLTADTPASLKQCEKTTLTWSGGKPWYTVTIAPPDDLAHAEPSVVTNATAVYDWVVRYPAGGQISFKVEDGAGTTAVSGAVTVDPSDDFSCL